MISKLKQRKEKSSLNVVSMQTILLKYNDILKEYIFIQNDIL